MTQEQLQDLITVAVAKGIDSKRTQLVNAEYLNQKDSAKFLGISVKTFKELTIEYDIKRYQVYSKRMYKKSELVEMMNKLAIN